MNLVRFSFILLLLSILIDNCISDQPKVTFGGIIARDCNMIKPPNKSCKQKEVVPILARQYYRLYYFKMVCNAINLGDNIIAVPTLCFETGVPAPGEFVAVDASHNWCYDAPEHVARDFISIVRDNVSITFVRLIPPLPEPCHPLEISDPASEPRMMKGFNWNSRKTFDKSDSYDRCVSSVPSALLFSRPNEFWGFQHPICGDPIPIKGYIDELNELNSGAGNMQFVETTTSKQEPEPTTPVLKFSGNDAADLEKSEDEMDKLKHNNEMLNHTIEDLKAKIEDDEQKIHDLENNFDQDRKHIKDSIEELREQEQTNQQGIEDLEKTMINDEEKLKELEDAVKQPNQNSAQVNKPIEDLKKEVEDEAIKDWFDENGKMNELQSVIDELHKLLLEADADKKKIDELESILETAQKNNSKLINTIEDLMETVENNDKEIENLKDFKKQWEEGDSAIIEPQKHELANKEAINKTANEVGVILNGDDKQRELMEHLESVVDEVLEIVNEIEKQDEVTNTIINDLQEKVENLTLQDQIKDQKIRDLESKINHTSDHIDKLDSNFAEFSTNITNQLKDNRNGCENLTHQMNILTNNKCFNECENFVQTSNEYIEHVQNFIENVNGTLKNNAEEIEQFQEFMEGSQLEIARIEQIVRELVEKFFNNLNNWSKFKIEIDEKVDNVVHTNEQLQEAVTKADDTLKHLSKYVNY